MILIVLLDEFLSIIGLIIFKFCDLDYVFGYVFKCLFFFIFLVIYMIVNFFLEIGWMFEIF